MQKNAINLFIFNIVNTLAQFLIVIILSHNLEKSDYATFRQLFLPFEMIAPILGIGLSSSIFYFYSRFTEKSKLLQVCLLLLAIACLLFQISLNVGIDQLLSQHLNNPDLKNYLSILGLFSFFSLANTVLYSYFILEDKVKYSILINSLANLVLVTCVYIFSVKFPNLSAVIYIRVIIYGVIMLAMLTSSSLFKDKYLSFRELKSDCIKVCKGSLPIGLSLFIGALSFQIDKLLVSNLSSPERYAVYINGAFEVPLIAVITTSISGASFGLFSVYCKDKNFSAAIDLFRKIIVVSSLIIFPCFFYLFIEAKAVITVLFGEGYQESYIVFRIYLFLLTIRVIQYGNVLIALGKSNILLVRSIIELILSLILSIVFFKIFDINGVALGVVTSVLLWTVPYNLYIIKKGFNSTINSIIPFRPIIKVVACCLIATVFCVILHYFIIPIDTKILQLILTSSVFFGVYFCSVYFSKFIAIDLKSKYKIKLLW